MMKNRSAQMNIRPCVLLLLAAGVFCSPLLTYGGPDDAVAGMPGTPPQTEPEGDNLADNAIPQADLEIGAPEATENTAIGTPEDGDLIPGGLAGPVDADAVEVARLLNGKFNSNDQSISNPAYFDLSLSSCLVRAPDYGNLVLYVEQAASDTPTQPYRQRLYVITGGGNVRSEFWAPNVDVELSGVCSKDEQAEIAGDQFTLLDGCGVWFTKGQDEGFEGSTEGKGCASTLRGASYVSSEVTLTEGRVQSWDQGFDANDTQVWGATDGPYNFARITEIVSPEAWAAEVVKAAQLSNESPAADEVEAQPSSDESSATSGALSFLSLHTNQCVICSRFLRFSFFTMTALCPIVMGM